LKLQRQGRRIQMKCRIFRTDSIGDFDILLPIVVEQANEHRSDAPTVKAPPCALAVRWRLHRSQSLPHHGASGSGVWRTLPPPAGGVNGRPRCSSDPDGLLPRQDGSLGQLPPQPPSEAAWARARAVDAPVDLGSSRRVWLRSSAIRRTTAAWEGMPAGSPGASRATRAVLRDPGLSWVQWATSVRLGASYSSVVRACVRVAHHAHVRVLRALRGVVRCF